MRKIEPKIRPTKKIWIDGELTDWKGPKSFIHVSSYSLHYGIGVFEGIRYYETPKGPAIFRLKDHIDRLFDSARIKHLKINFSKSEVLKACVEVAKINGLKEGYLRPIVFIGTSKMGVGHISNHTKLAIMTWSWGPYLGKKKLKKGIRLKISPFIKHRSTLIWKAKAVGNYDFSDEAKLEALSKSYDEALLLDENGFVAEASAENIFIVANKKLITPPSSAPILLGITRDTIIKIAPDLHLPVLERNFTKDELYSAEEAFLTGTAAEITPIREVDNHLIGKGRPGPITKKLQNIYFKIVRGEIKNYKAWLTYIP